VSLQLRYQLPKDVDGRFDVPMHPLPVLVGALDEQVQAATCASLASSTVFVDRMGAPFAAVTLGCGQVFQYARNASSDRCPLAHK